MAWSIDISATARDQLAKLDRAEAKRITSFLRKRLSALDDPRSIGKPLKGSTLGDFWCYRVGDHRLISDIQDEVLRVLVLKIGHRSDVYKT